MEIGEMVPQVLLPLRTGPRKRKADLEFSARQEVRDLIKALVCDVIPALPEDGITTTVDFAADALAPPEPAAAVRGEQPYSGTACLVVSGRDTVCIADHMPHAGPHRDMWGFEWWGADLPVVNEARARTAPSVVVSTDEAIVAAASADALPSSDRNSCLAWAEHPDGSGDGLYCWRPGDHDGSWHYDQADGLAWRLGEGSEVARSDEPARCGERPYPPGSEGDDGTECILPAGHDGEHDDGPEPYPAAVGVRCGAEDGDWRCGAQRGHGGPDHLNYAAGEIRHRWPRTAERCPDCGRASCTGEDCYWPDEAGIARPEASRS